MYKGYVECKDLLEQLVYKANVEQKGIMVPKGLLENKAIVVNEMNVVNAVKSAFKVILQIF